MATNQSPPECPSCGLRLQFARIVSNCCARTLTHSFECIGCGIIVIEGVTADALGQAQAET